MMFIVKLSLYLFYYLNWCLVLILKLVISNANIGIRSSYSLIQSIPISNVDISDCSVKYLVIFHFAEQTMIISSPSLQNA